MNQLRRSRNDRVVTGVAGGLGEYFGIDPVIFRVLFAVLSFFGGAGVAAYLVFWLLLPEADVETSVLDRSVEHFRANRTPPWVVIAVGALLMWVMWFSWWQPGPSFPAFVVLAAVLIFLTRRAGNAPVTPPPANAPTATDSAPPGGPQTSGPLSLTKTTPLIAPLSDSRRSMQAWFSEANAAHRERVRRRRPIKIAVGLGLAAGWAIAAIADLTGRITFPVYLWIGLAVLSVGLITSIATRRATWSMVPPLAILSMATLFFGGTHASLGDGSGQISWRPTAAAQLADQRQFAGESTIDLTQIKTLEAPRTITITQGAGRVVLRIPSTLNATVHGKVHAGEIQVDDSRTAGDYVTGWNVVLDVPAQTGKASGAVLTINVDVTVGRIEIDRI